MMGNLASGFACPECGSEEAFVDDLMEDADGYTIGTVLTCRACEHHWEQIHRE